MLTTEKLEWDKMNGLIPAIVQDAFDGRVLMQAYMNREALEATLSSGQVTFWSRSRNELWVKGETSGNRLELASIHADCDGDSLLILARPRGAACHLGTDTCFDSAGRTTPELAFLRRLEAVIGNRDEARSKESYTSRLLESGVKRVAQKVGEEGVEAALAGAAGTSEELLDEAADLVFHLLVLLRARTCTLAELVTNLKNRHSA